jgi:hypothetical protein
MNVPSDRRADAFSDWLEAQVAEGPAPVHEPTADPELQNLCAAAERFHGLSERWTQEAMVASPPVTTWEDLMTRNAHTLLPQPSIVVADDPAGKWPGRWEAWNRFASGVLVAAIIIAVGAGAWRVAADRQAGTGTEPPAATGVFGLQPAGDESAMATPDGTGEPERSVPVTTPVDQFPGIVNAIGRDYLTASDRPPGVPDMLHIGVSVYRFDSPDNAEASYDLLVSNITEDLTATQANNDGYTVVTADLGGPGERGNLVRLDFADATGYQSQEYVLTVHDTYVFAVMTITSGPLEAGATPIAAAGPTAIALDLATALVANGQPSPEEAMFYEDGTSTGGDWGFMPDAGDPLLAGLLPTMDGQIYPTNPNAQGAEASFPPDAQELTGIRAAVYREHASEGVFIGSHTIGGATPLTEADLASTRYSTITIWVYQLDNAKNAAVAYDRLGSGLLGSLTTLNQGGGQERLISEDLTGIGDGAMRSQLTVTSTGQGLTNQTTLQYITVQHGEFVFVVSGMSRVGPVESLPATGDGPDPMLDLAGQIASDGEVSPDEPVFAENGTSTGGLWGFMPAQGDPLLMGLVPFTDQVMYPVPER